MTDRLVSTQWLHDNLDNDDVRVFDCTVAMHPDGAGGFVPESGRDRYAAEQIPGAAFLDLMSDFSDQDSDIPFMKPDAARTQALMGTHGIGNHHKVVLYSTGLPMWATRVYWVLRWAGHDNVAMLDGGFSKWTSEGRPLTSEPTSYPATTFDMTEYPDYWVDRHAVEKSIGKNNQCLINALMPDVFSGEAEHSYGRKGHIPGSRNVPFATIFSDDGTFKSKEELRGLFDAASVSDDEPVMCYCGGGIAATVVGFALHLVGHPDVRVYDGSMYEWSRHPELPLVTGT